MQTVDILGVTEMHPPEGPRQSMGLLWRGNQVNMVGHQTEAEDRHIRGGGFLGQYVKVGKAIIIKEKYILTVIATLHNVVWYFGEDNASGSRHEEQSITVMADVNK